MPFDNIKKLINDHIGADPNEKDWMLKELKELEELEKLKEVTSIARNLTSCLAKNLRVDLAKLQEISPNYLAIYTEQLLETLRAADFNIRKRQADLD